MTDRMNALRGGEEIVPDGLTAHELISNGGWPTNGVDAGGQSPLTGVESQVFSLDDGGEVFDDDGLVGPGQVTNVEAYSQAEPFVPGMGPATGERPMYMYSGGAHPRVRRPTAESVDVVPGPPRRLPPGYHGMGQLLPGVSSVMSTAGQAVTTAMTPQITQVTKEVAQPTGQAFPEFTPAGQEQTSGGGRLLMIGGVVIGLLGAGAISYWLWKRGGLNLRSRNPRGGKSRKGVRSRRGGLRKRNEECGEE